MPQTAIAIIGSGFSGTLLSLLLRNTAPAGTPIYLIERSARFATGLAYGTANPHHLLNVPAGRMSAFHDIPLDFLHWAQRQPADVLGGVAASEDAFLPRSAYGAYLQHLLDRPPAATAPGRLIRIHDTVLAAEENAGGVTLRLASHAPLTVALAVLATGNAPPSSRFDGDDALTAAGLWRNDPWDGAALAGLDRAAPVLLVGCGLTMVDLAISLLDNRHTGPIHALSRHGLLPRRHVTSHPSLPLATPLAPRPASPMASRLAPLTRLLRQEIAAAMAAGGDWRPAIDALRPVTQALWRGFSPAEKARFLRHLCTWWDVHRHRMPPASADRIDTARAAGQLRLHAGRIVDLAARDGGARVTWQPRGGTARASLQVARIINCTGPCSDAGRSTDPLTRALLHSGAVRADALRLGFDVTDDGAVFGADGVASRRLFAIGPLTKGAAWEITAVPDIRRQCRDIAAGLAERLTALPAQSIGRLPERRDGRRSPQRAGRF